MVLPDDISHAALLAAVVITCFAGFVKGMVGFAMPLILISAFSSFMTTQDALAGLILPTLITNIYQAFRQGVPAAAASARRYWRFVLATVVLLIVSAQFAGVIPRNAFLVLLGVPVTAFAALQLMGCNLALQLAHRTRAEWVLGIVGGLYGGVAGVWGPPLMVYLLSVGASKVETIRVQGVVFLLGAVVLLGAHLQTGLLTAPRLWFSAMLVVPAVLGQILGLQLQDRLDQARFRQWTQILLVLSGLNLVRQAVWG